MRGKAKVKNYKYSSICKIKMLILMHKMMTSTANDNLYYQMKFIFLFLEYWNAIILYIQPFPSLVLVLIDLARNRSITFDCLLLKEKKKTLGKL